MTNVGSMKLDDVFVKYIDGKGKLRVFLLLLLAHVAMYAPFLSMSPVLTMETPPHWCHHPAFDSPALANCSLQQIAMLTAPLEFGPNGKVAPSSCRVYDVNLTELIDQSDAGILCPMATNNTFTWITSELNNASQSIPFPGGNRTDWPVKVCDSWVYGESFLSQTITQEFNLVCQNEWLKKNVYSINLTGYVLGNLLSGLIADKFGRRKCLLGSLVLCFISSLAMYLSPFFSMYLAVRFITSALSISKTFTVFTMMMELCSPRWRSFYGQLYMCFWAVGYVAVAGAAYFISTWRLLGIIPTCIECGILITLFGILLPESPRWLLLHNRHDEAMAALQRLTNEKLPADLTIEEHVDVSTRTHLDLCRKPQIRLTTFCLACGWFANGIIYYGLSMGVGELGGNVLVNFIISGLIELPAYMLLAVVLHFFGRVIPYAALFFLSSICLFCMIPLIDNSSLHHLYVALSMAGKLFITASFSMVFVVATEIYPTSVRGIGFTATAMASRISSPLNPYVFLLKDIHMSIPWIVFGAIGLVAGVATLWLPETRGKKLTQTLDEGEVFMRDNKICRRRMGKIRRHTDVDRNGISNATDEVADLTKPTSVA